jgi:Skp family chaperone for outer membrane proteins
MRPGDRQPSRRALLVGGLGLAALTGAAARAQAASEVIIVSRERILREAEAARRLRDAEEEMTARLQAQIDATKVQFAEEEEELTRLRGELAGPEFEARIADFDQRVRAARRVAQERAAALQKGFQEARAAIVAALPELMERLRVEAGARLVVNAEQVLAADPAVDLTDRAIALFDADGPSPPLPQVDLAAPLTEPPADAASGPAPGAASSGAASGAAPQAPSEAESQPPQAAPSSGQ